jgi:hypothetical protein
MYLFISIYLTTFLIIYNYIYIYADVLKRNATQESVTRQCFLSPPRRIWVCASILAPPPSWVRISSLRQRCSFGALTLEGDKWVIKLKETIVRQTDRQTETDRQTDRHTDRQTDRPTDGPTDRPTDLLIYLYTYIYLENQNPQKS